MNYSPHSRWSEDTKKATLTGYGNCTQNKWIIQYSTVVWGHTSYTHILWKLHTAQMNHSVYSSWAEDTKNNTDRLWKLHTEQMNHSAHSRWLEDTKATLTSYEIAHRKNESFGTFQVIWGPKGNTHILWKLHTEQMDHSVHSRWSKVTKATLTCYENCHRANESFSTSRWSGDTKATLTNYENCTQNKWTIQHTPGDLRTQKQHSHPMKIAHRTNGSFSTLQVIQGHQSNAHLLWKLHTEQMDHLVHSRWSKVTKATLTCYENCTQNKWIIQHIPGDLRTQNQHSLAMKIAQRTWIIQHTPGDPRSQ
jgi:hypothetical protein